MAEVEKTSSVQLVEDVLVSGRNHRPLELLRRRQHVVLGCPQLRDERKLFGNLELYEFLLFADTLAGRSHSLHDPGLLAEYRELTCNSHFRRQGFDPPLLRADESHREGAAGSAIHHRELHEVAERQGLLHLSECHILSIGTLPQVLLPINDLQRAILADLTDVARAEESDAADVYPIFLVLLEQFRLGICSADVVARTDTRTTNQDLTSRHSNLGLVLVGVQIVALGPIS
mmetsp:Transcript_144622/g.376375  ORF Transcript_144622/g.376375 Transcript_144622/m.376375 type:complete len:231 (+) Transcript_144622:451-1143(+)